MISCFWVWVLFGWGLTRPCPGCMHDTDGVPSAALAKALYRAWQVADLGVGLLICMNTLSCAWLRKQTEERALTYQPLPDSPQ